MVAAKPLPPLDLLRRLYYIDKPGVTYPIVAIPAGARVFYDNKEVA